MEGFDEALLPSLTSLRFFRPLPEAEIDATLAAYDQGGVDALLRVWKESIAPNRVELRGTFGWMFGRAGKMPPLVNGLGFLATVRAVLDAGVRFRATLRPEVRAALERDFPWLEHRHEHIPTGWTPRFDFPDALRVFIDVVPLGTTLEDDALAASRARWQLVCALNEVEQSALSRFLAGHFRLPELLSHAAYEERLARSYFAAWSPRATRALWRQCLLLLDALNAAVFELFASGAPSMITHTTLGALSPSGRAAWRSFATAAALASPPRVATGTQAI